MGRDISGGRVEFHRPLVSGDRSIFLVGLLEVVADQKLGIGLSDLVGLAPPPATEPAVTAPSQVTPRSLEPRPGLRPSYSFELFHKSGKVSYIPEMAVDPELLEILACPNCKTPVTLVKNGAALKCGNM